PATLAREKIRTAGRGYMVAGGLPLPQPRPDHAAAVAEMALAMREAAAMAAAGFGERLQLRIGVHSGALIAGVSGTHKFVYDVWGATVKTATRMESSPARSPGGARPRPPSRAGPLWAVCPDEPGVGGGGGGYPRHCRRAGEAGWGTRCGRDRADRGGGGESTRGAGGPPEGRLACALP